MENQVVKCPICQGVCEAIPPFETDPIRKVKRVKYRCTKCGHEFRVEYPLL